MKRILSQISILEIINIVPTVKSYSKLLLELGCIKNGGNQKQLKK